MSEVVGGSSGMTGGAGDGKKPGGDRDGNRDDKKQPTASAISSAKNREKNKLVQQEKDRQLVEQDRRLVEQQAQINRLMGRFQLLEEQAGYRRENERLRVLLGQYEHQFQAIQVGEHEQLLLNQLAYGNEQIDGLRQQVANLNVRMMERDDQNADLTRRLAETERRHNLQIADLTTRLEESERRNAELDRQNAQQAGEIARQAGEIARLQQQVDRIEKEADDQFREGMSGQG